MAIVCTAVMYTAIRYIAIRYSCSIHTTVFGHVFWMFWDCFLDDLVMFSGCFGNVFWRHFTNQATPSNPSVPDGGCKFADAGTKNKCPNGKLPYRYYVSNGAPIRAAYPLQIDQVDK